MAMTTPGSSTLAALWPQLLVAVSPFLLKSHPVTSQNVSYEWVTLPGG